VNLRKDHYRLFLALVGESKERMNYDFDGSLRQDLLSGTYELPRAAPVCAEGILARSLARSLCGGGGGGVESWSRRRCCPPCLCVPGRLWRRRDLS